MDKIDFMKLKDNELIVIPNKNEVNNTCFFHYTHQDSFRQWRQQSFSKETAEKFHIPVLDLYHDLGIDPHDPKDYETYTVDGLHFNDDGHELLAQNIL